MGNKRFISKAALNKIDISKPMTIEQMQALNTQMAGTAYNRLQKFTAASTSKHGAPESYAKTILLGGLQDLYGVGKDIKWTALKQGDLTDRGYKALLKKQMELLYTFLMSKGSTVTGAKELAAQTAEDIGMGDDWSFADIGDFWDIYEEFREEIEAIIDGSPMYQHWIQVMMHQGVDKEEIKRRVMKDVAKRNKPSYRRKNTGRGVRVK